MTEKKALRVQDYIEHMLGAIERIESYVHDLDQAAFERSTLVQDAVIRNFEIIGEAAKQDSACRFHLRATSPAAEAMPNNCWVNSTVIASAAKQSRGHGMRPLDCFVARAPRNDG